MTTPEPVHPSRYTATISTRNGWWFRYSVDRQHGIMNLEAAGTRRHRTLKGARRVARRWVGRNTGPEPVVIERHGGPTGIANL